MKGILKKSEIVVLNAIIPAEPVVMAVEFARLLRIESAARDCFEGYGRSVFTLKKVAKLRSALGIRKPK